MALREAREATLGVSTVNVLITILIIFFVSVKVGKLKLMLK